MAGTGMRATGATRRLGWGIVLTLAATVAIFVLEPRDSSMPTVIDRIPELDRPWYGRYAAWLGMVVRLEFLPDQIRLGDPTRSELALYVFVTFSVAVAAAMLTWVVALIVLSIVRRRNWLRRTGTTVLVVSVTVPLTWLTLSLAAAAEWLNDTVGVDALPTSMGSPLTAWRESGWAMGWTQLHQTLLPAMVLSFACAPVVIWLARSAVLRREATDKQADATIAGQEVQRLMTRVLPVFAVGALIVERALGSYGAGRLVFNFSPEYAFPMASGVLLLGIVVSVVRWLAELVQVAGAAMMRWAEESTAVEPPPRRSRPPRQERFRVLWVRVRADRRAHAGAVVLAVVIVAAAYVRLWSATGPGDTVSTDGAGPPSADHWLGVDTLGRDQLVRLAAAVGGSLFVAAVAAIVATLLGLALVMATARLPERAGGRIRAGADLLIAVPAAVWLVVPAGLALPMTAFAWDAQRLSLALALGALGVPVAVRLLWHRCWFMVRETNTPTWLATPVTGTGLAVMAGALPAESIATFRLVTLDERSPTLGTLLGRTVHDVGSDTYFFLAPPHVAVSAWPWLWYPPAVVTALLATGVMLLAAGVLRHPER